MVGVMEEIFNKIDEILEKWANFILYQYKKKFSIAFLKKNGG
jgi:hypothetical protein